MIRTVAEAGDATFRNEIAQYLDLGAFIKHVAIEMFLNESDGVLGDWGTTNFYLYRPPNSNLHVFIPWDKSETMHDRALSIFHNVDDVPEQVQNRIMTRAMKYPDLANLYLDVLSATADSAAEPGDGDQRGWMSGRSSGNSTRSATRSSQTRRSPIRMPTSSRPSMTSESSRRTEYFVKTSVANKR